MSKTISLCAFFEKIRTKISIKNIVLLLILLLLPQEIIAAQTPPEEPVDPRPASKNYGDLLSYWGLCHRAIIHGDFNASYLLAKKNAKDSLQLYGADDPLTKLLVHELKCLEKASNWPQKDKTQFCQSHTHADSLRQKVDDLLRSISPTPEEVDKLVRDHVAYLIDPNLAGKLPEYDLSANTMNLARCFAYANDPATAVSLAKEAINYDKMLGLVDSPQYFRDLAALCRYEQANNLPPQSRRKGLLKIIKYFHEEGTRKQRFVWEEYHARSVLAEDYYREGKKDEADKMFAELRKQFLEEERPKPDDGLFAWSWYDARRAYEKGEYNNALFIFPTAKRSCRSIEYRGMSRPWAAQQMLELEAKVLRQVDKNPKALSTEKDADQIAKAIANRLIKNKAQKALLAEKEAEQIAKDLAKCREALAKIPVKLPRASKRPDGTIHFDFDNPKIIQKGEAADKEK
ncbi:MAG: hypothetical protein PVH19_12355 [Planctomycetia bacterium]